MSELHPALEAVATLAADQRPAQQDESELCLARLSLYVSAPEFELHDSEDGHRCIVAYQAALKPRGPGIVIVAVGLGDSQPQSIMDAASQWTLGVLPVLAMWRGGVHSCFVGDDTAIISDPSPNPFHVLVGAVLQRGEQDPSDQAWVDTKTYISLLRPHLQRLSMWGPFHWLECFALRRSDGRTLATCRLDNIDWPIGQELLRNNASSWPGVTPTIQTRRQFILLYPEQQCQGSRHEKNDPGGSVSEGAPNDGVQRTRFARR